jgi:hypothetical protein
MKWRSIGSAALLALLWLKELLCDQLLQLQQKASSWWRQLPHPVHVVDGPFENFFRCGTFIDRQQNHTTSLSHHRVGTELTLDVNCGIQSTQCSVFWM